MAGVFTSFEVGKNLQTARVNVSGNGKQGGMKLKGKTARQLPWCQSC